MKAVIAQSDLVTAYGWGLEPLWEGLLAGQTAVTSIPCFSRSQPANNPVALIPDLKVAPGSSRVRAMLDRLLSRLVGKLDPQTPLILATTIGEIEFIERAALEEDCSLISQAEPRQLLQHIQQMLKLSGTTVIVSAACASSSAALTRAARMIEQGIAPAVLVVTCDSLSEFVYSGFSTLLSLCDTPARPFDAARCGLSLGEAAAWALVTRADSKLVGDNSASILGWANTADAVHMTAPDRAAGGLSRSITRACRMADITPGQIGLIAAHGTATIYNDAMELTAFANTISHAVPTFSVKGGTGHTLAAAGLVQILAACRAMKLRIAPPTVGLSVPDERAVGWVHGTATPIADETMVLSTNSGFGGVNTSIVLGPPRSRVQRSSSERPTNAPAILAAAWFSPHTTGCIGRPRSDCNTGAMERPPAPTYSEEPDRTPENPALASTSEPASGTMKSHQSYVQKSPELSATKEMLDLIGQSPKYFARMTAEARRFLVTAGLAIQSAGWKQTADIGILAAGYTGWLAGSAEYFRDYVAQGRSLGRANLFIYTLPTSAPSEVAVALGLTGPTLHLQHSDHPAAYLIREAIAIVQNQEAAGVLCLWGDEQSAVCVAVGNGSAAEALGDIRWDQTLAKLVEQLGARAGVNDRRAG
jgi:3-oxoacyl-[acyl-carrier-protein] synthase II